jgi:hypothetical protein
MTGQEFKELQTGDILLEYSSMRHWIVLGMFPALFRFKPPGYSQIVME